MVWMIIIVALLMVVGPALYLLPGRQEKDQRIYRQAARSAGLAVELATLYKIESETWERVSSGGETRVPRFPCARYGLPQEQPLSRLPEVHRVRGRTLDWRVNPELPDAGNPDLAEVIEPFLARLPAGARGLSVTAGMVWVFMVESLSKPGDGAVAVSVARAEIDALAGVLRELRGAVAAWHARNVS